MPPPLHDNWLRQFCTATILFFPLLNVFVVGLRIYGRVTMKQFGIGRFTCIEHFVQSQLTKKT